MSAPVPPWPDSVVQGVADVLGDTDTGLTGSEIGRLLATLNIPDPGSGVTKRHRLGHALLHRQALDTSARRIVTFITRAMDPVSYIQSPALRQQRQDALNEVLVFVGLHVRDNGQVGRGPHAETLDEAAQHANSLRAELRRRGTHPDVLRYCSVEILTRNVFHAQLEATKSIFDKIRNRTGLVNDGALLVDAALPSAAAAPRSSRSTASPPSPNATNRPAWPTSSRASPACSATRSPTTPGSTARSPTTSCSNYSRPCR